MDKMQVDSAVEGQVFYADSKRYLRELLEKEKTRILDELKTFNFQKYIYNQVS